VNYNEAAAIYSIHLNALDCRSYAVTEESNKKVCRERRESNGVRT